MAFFPTSVPTLTELLDAKNNTEVVLDGAVNNSVTTFTVDDTSAIPTAGRLTFGDDASFETISYTGTTATTITGITRGVDGTSAASHLDNALLGVFQSAKYHNILAEEINAIAQNLSTRFGLGATDVIINSGSVGIGTSAPQRDLHIHGSGSSQIKLSDTDSGSGNTDGIDIDLNSNEDFKITNWEAGKSIIFATGGANDRVTIDSSGNVGIATSVFGASAAGVLAIANGTQGAAAANMVQVISEDLTAGNTQLSIQTEGTPVGSGTPSQDKTIAMKVNGTQYYMLASTVAS